MAEIRSHSPPVPLPSTMRPPESAGSDVSVRASMGADRVGKAREVPRTSEDESDGGVPAVWSDHPRQ